MAGRVSAVKGKNSLYISGGIIESIWIPGSMVDVDDAREAMRAVDVVSGGTPMLMLSEMTDVEFSAAARYEFARSTSVLAIAVLGSSPVDRVIAAGMNRHTRYPHEFFTSRNVAIAWLEAVLDDVSHPIAPGTKDAGDKQSPSQIDSPDLRETYRVWK